MLLPNRTKMMQSAVLVLLLLSTAACGAKEDSAARELELPGDDLKRLVVDHRNGEIKIAGVSDTDKIEVSARAQAKGIGMDKLELKLEARQDTAYLDARFKAQFLAMGSGTIDLEVKVPKRMKLDITSHRDGDLYISDLSSSVDIDNINGDIQVSNLSGCLEIDNRDGDIVVRDIGSDVSIRNVNGHITVDRVEGSAEIRVGDGSLDINRVAKDVSITQTGNGDVKIGEVKGKILRGK